VGVLDPRVWTFCPDQHIPQVSLVRTLAKKTSWHGRETEYEHELEGQREEDQDEEERTRRLGSWRLTLLGAPLCVDELTQKLTTVCALEHSARYRPNTRRPSLPLIQSHSAQTIVGVSQSQSPKSIGPVIGPPPWLHEHREITKLLGVGIERSI
jgi:hypothetical protein